MPPAPPERSDLGSKHRILLRVERFSRRRYLLVFALALLAIAAGSFFGSRLDLESDLLALIPEGNRQIDTLRDALEQFGSIDYLMVLVQAAEGTEGEGPDAIEDFADEFAERLREQEDLIEAVEYRLQLDEEFLELFYENALLFLPPDRLPELERRLGDDAIRKQVEENRLTLASPTGTLADDLIRNDPLGLMPLLLDRVVGTRGGLQIDLSDGYYLARDGATLIMIVKPHGPSADLEFDERLLERVGRIERETREALAEDSDDGGAAAVRVRYGGNYAAVVDEARLIRKDVRFNLLFSLCAVSALYWLCYRRFAALLYSSIPLLVGQALTFVLAFFVLRGLNASSSAFTALLMGLGTDFVIVIYARYIEERRAGRTIAEATERMIGETGLGVFTGAITSAGTFLAMTISQFRGLRDLGFLIGFGILLCGVAILFLLPAMITWNEGVRKRKVDSVKKLHLQSFLLERLIPFSARHRTLVVGAVALLSAASLFAATRLDFDDTSQVLRSPHSPAYAVQREIAEIFGASPSYMMAIAEAPTVEEAVRLTATVESRLRPFVESGVVGSVDSVTTYLPPLADQERVLDAVQRGGVALDPGRIRATFLEALDEAGFRREPFEEVLARTERFLTPSRPVQLEDLQRRGLEGLLERYLAVEEGRARIVTYFFLTDPQWKRRPPAGLVETLTGGDPGIVVTGTNVMNAEFRRIFMTEAPRSVGIGLVFVFVLLWVDFRSLRLTAIAMTQLVAGVVMMLGLMKLFDVHLNYVNAFVATMMLGVGIDYSIHLVHRMSLSGGRVESGLLETGKAVVMAALTNIAGFGTLFLGSYPALRSFGLVAIFGSLTCLFTALTLVPALMGRTAGERAGEGG